MSQNHDIERAGIKTSVDLLHGETWNCFTKLMGESRGWVNVNTEALAKAAGVDKSYSRIRVREFATVGLIELDPTFRKLLHVRARFTEHGIEDARTYGCGFVPKAAVVRNERASVIGLLEDQVTTLKRVIHVLEESCDHDPAIYAIGKTLVERLGLDGAKSLIG